MTRAVCSGVDRGIYDVGDPDLGVFHVDHRLAVFCRTTHGAGREMLRPVHGRRCLQLYSAGTQQQQQQPQRNARLSQQLRWNSSFYRAMLCIRGTSHGPVSVRLSVCPSQVGVLSKRMNESSWFLACELPSTRPTLC